MKRSSGVTAASVVLLVGSAGLVLMVLATVLLGVLANHRAIAGEPNLEAGVVIVGLLMYGALAAWGIGTAVGIIRLRPWGRISILVMSALALFGSLMGLLAMLVLLPHMNMPQPGVAGPIRTVLIVTFGLPCAIAAWWLVLFTRRSVAQQFVPSGLERAPAPALALGLPPSGGRRPASITVIAIVLLVGALSLVLMLSFGRFLWPAGLPAFVLGVLVTGWKAMFYYVAFGAIELAIGLGLWWMRPWARIGAITLCILSIANMVAMAFRPSAFLQVMAMANSVSRLAEPIEIPSAFLWVIATFGTALAVVALWFLITSNAAFAAPDDGGPGWVKTA